MNDPDPEYCERRSPRLRGYDYSQAGAYFVTICTQMRVQCFGSLVEGVVHLTPAGQMAQYTWIEISSDSQGVDLDTFLVMPDHLHGIVVLRNQPTGRSLSDVMRRFKSLTTARYRHGVAQHGWPSFPGRLWQRSYYDHIVRSEADLDRIREYITTNPVRSTLRLGSALQADQTGG